MGTVRALALRLKTDLSTGNRAAEYASLLRSARDGGYRLVSLAELWDLTAGDGPPDDVRYLAIRHDVDIRDEAGNRMFRQIERAYGAHATYYFRLWTAPAHEQFIADLLTDGCEVGYHFEEAATVAKERRLRDRETALAHRDEIAGRFILNAQAFRRRWNPGLRSVAAHGDWINRRLGFVNHEFVDDALLAGCGLDFEAYQERLMRSAEVYVSDVAPLPARWARGYGLSDALRDGRSRIYLLTHERQWHGSPRAAAQANLDRLADELRYRFGPPVER